ncbi:thioredoxin-dependent thiol peroxidase [Gemmatimonas sp.]|jgi:peroxiredoxin Q/BCP|uniref:thioredoxin-dependent thiol peroxidase n=1 Tax=Gemmatimonas sp. TaxID=1962908 RepID=UPI0037C00CA4
MPIAAGQPAPDFTLPTDSGESFTLSSLRGQWVVLYAYPKDDTSGCTTEACEFRDLFPKFKKGKHQAVVLGISPDSVKSHQKFKTKYALPFTLLADEDKVALQAYDIWKEKSMYGRKYMGVERTTFVINPEGVIAHVFEKVKPAGHAEAVMAVIG